MTKSMKLLPYLVPLLVFIFSLYSHSKGNMYSFYIGSSCAFLILTVYIYCDVSHLDKMVKSDAFFLEKRVKVLEDRHIKEFTEDNVKMVDGKLRLIEVLKRDKSGNYKYEPCRMSKLKKNDIFIMSPFNENIDIEETVPYVAKSNAYRRDSDNEWTVIAVETEVDYSQL